VRFATTNTIEAVQAGYGTVLTANTMSVLDMGQCANSLVDLVYIKAIDQDIYISPTTVVSTGVLLHCAASEACMFKPNNTAGDTVLSIGITSDTDGAQYEYLIVGQSS
jgi:hypothetical protein